MSGTDLGGSAPHTQTIFPKIYGALRQEGGINFDGKAIGGSFAFCELQSCIARIRKAAGNVIVTGERGVGKELVARSLRKGLGTPAAEPFEVINAAAIHRGTAESELFGHERGSYTGATFAREGIFERANGGIVYFDEIADMPLELQASLLRVIQEQEVVRIGARSARRLSFRVVCATNKNLEKKCGLGEFRRDLLDRLGAFVVRVPPLRERREDIPLLVEHFLRRHAAPGCRYVVTDEVWDILTQYDWPGNIRELSNVVENAVTRCDGGALLPGHILDKLHVALARTVESSAYREPCSERDRSVSPGCALAAPSDATNAAAPNGTVEESGRSFRESMKEYERGLLVRAFHNAGGNVARMARRLRLHRSCVYIKLREHGIDQSGWSEGHGVPPFGGS